MSDEDGSCASDADAEQPVSWEQARWRVAVSDLWDAVERGERKGSTGRVTVEASDLRLVLDYIARDAVEETP